MKIKKSENKRWKIEKVENRFQAAVTFARNMIDKNNLVIFIFFWF